MNTLDAIIALCAIMGCFGLMISATNAQKEGVLEANDSIKAKSTALKCAAIIDSMFSNSAEEYEDSINCGVKNGGLYSEQKNKSKTAKTIARVKKEDYIEVEKSEHYK